VLAISVVIPSRRGSRLALALEALAAQTLSVGRFEVIVAQDPASERLPTEPPAELTVRWLRAEEACGPAAKRNLGWRAARAKLVAFTDDDCEPTPGWLEHLIEAARKAPDGILQGRTTPNPRELDRMGPFSRTLTVEGPSPWFATCNVAYPAQLLRALDGFDEEYSGVGGEDTDLAWRAQEAGAPVVWVPDADVHHAVMDLGPVGKLRLALRWSPAVRVFADHPQLRAELQWGVFWKRSHALLLVAGVGALATRRWLPAAALVVPYGRQLRARMAAERAQPILAPYYVLHDSVEMLAMVRGGLSTRVLIL
jgi:GT2 family glycosyltransferase